jgi:predicted phosphodiesterase
LKQPTRRYLVLSDVHSNLEALCAVLADAKQHGPFHGKLCAGDLLGYGPDPNEVIELLQEEGFVCVAGNHDRAVRSGGHDRMQASALEAARINHHLLNVASRRFLARLRSAPHVHPGGGFAMVHGSFDGTDDPQDHSYEDHYILTRQDAMMAMKRLLDFQTIGGPVYLGIFGHTHFPCIASGWIDVHEHDRDLHGVHDVAAGLYTVEGSQVGCLPRLDPWHEALDLPAGPGNPVPRFLFNPGSVGQPRNGCSAAFYGVLELRNRKLVLHFYNVEYNIGATQRRMRELDFPEDLIERLPLGR